MLNEYAIVHANIASCGCDWISSREKRKRIIVQSRKCESAATQHCCARGRAEVGVIYCTLPRYWSATAGDKRANLSDLPVRDSKINQS